MHRSLRNDEDVVRSLSVVGALAGALQRHVDGVVSGAASAILVHVEELRRLADGYPLSNGEACDRCGNVHGFDVETQALMRVAEAAVVVMGRSSMPHDWELSAALDALPQGIKDRLPEPPKAGDAK